MAARTDFWLGRRVVLTGATGFIGHHLALRLVRHGAKVTALIRASSATQRLRNDGIECVVAPLDQPDALAQGAAGADLFFHLAGAVDFGNDWNTCRRTNMNGTVNALAAARSTGVRRFVHVSSIVAVGASREPRELNESAEWNLQHLRIPYVTTKYEAERCVLSNGGPPEVVVVNPASVVGPDDYSSSEFGTLCKRFWRGRIPFYFGGGNNFVDVRDVAAGMMLSAEKGRAGERYLLGGENLTFAEFFRLLAGVAGRRIFRMRLPKLIARAGACLADQWPRKKSRPYLTRAQARLLGWYFYFDSAKACKELGYQPRPLNSSLGDAHDFWMAKRAA